MIDRCRQFKVEKMETTVSMNTETPSQFSPFEQKAMDNYDEDLNENPFFQSLLASCPELFSQCVLEEWLICVPRRDSLPKYAFTLEDFTHHILRPVSRPVLRRHWSGESNSSNASNSSLAPSFGSSFSEDQSSSLISSKIYENARDERIEGTSLKGNWNYQTLTHINVEFSAQTLILDVEIPIKGSDNNTTDASKSNGFVQLRKEVLFDETFYTNDRRKYKVLCVASPLNSKVDIEDEGFGNSGLGLWNLTSLRDCIDFIWVKRGFKILETYDSYIKLFLYQHPALENLPLPVQRNLVNTLFIKCVEYAVGPEIADTPSLSEFLLQRLRIATETYVNNGVYRSLISAITSVTAAEDAFINKITRNLNELHPQDLEIDPMYWNILGRARHELSRISSYSSPLGKLACMKRTIRHIRSSSVAEGGDSSVLTTDELLPIWVYLIVKNPLGNWVAQLEFLRNFRFSSDEQPDNENSFYITTLEASLEHLKGGKVLAVSDNERDPTSPCDLGEAWLYNLHQDAYESDNPQLAEMFELIRLGNCKRLEEMIEEYEVQRYEFNKKQKEPKKINADLLCHPLCHCSKCSALCQSIIKFDPMIPAVDLATVDLLTLLHVACIYGRPKVVDILIGCGSNLEAKDAQGMTGLHYAASRGHQNAVLLLLHAGCDLQPTNNALNNPLHLASQNGHEGCVKALIYYAEQVGRNINLSSGNAKGDTALHFACRWGFIGIVDILTEHGAAITTQNIRHATPIDCAHDIHILRILQRSLRRRSLVQSDHGDYVNIEMMQKEECGGIVMLISEPTDPTSPKVRGAPNDQGSDGNESKSGSRRTSVTSTSPNLGVSNPTPSRKISTMLHPGMPNDQGSDGNESKPGSRIPSRQASVTSTSPNLRVSNSIPRSRKISTIVHPGENDSNSGIVEESMKTEKCLLTVVKHLTNAPSNSDFLVDHGKDFDFTEQEHLRMVQAENLDVIVCAQEVEAKRDRDILKLFTSIAIGDVPLSLFYLGIPAEEIDNAQSEHNYVNVIPVCHPLCPCHRCIAKNAGLNLGLDIKSHEGLSPLHLAVQCHIIVLVRILIMYGANINLQSSFEKKTALDFAIERGFDDIEDVLLTAGALRSTSFCPAAPEECEK